jgi:hypothetical protein
MLQQVVYSQNTVFYTCNCSYWSGGQRAGAPLRRAPGRRRGEAPTREGASGAGRGCGVACASALGREPVGRSRRPRIPFEGSSKEFWSSLRRELEGNSKGNGTLTRVVSGTSCNHLSALPRTVARSLRRNLKKNRRRRAMHSRRRRRLGTGVAVSEGANSNN